MSAHCSNVTTDQLDEGDMTAARIEQVEGWAFFRVVEPLVAEVDAGAADTIVGVLSLDGAPAADSGATVRTALEST